MKIGFISDIHANAQALEAVMADMRQSAVDSVVCLGDVATLGPSPREVVRMLRELDCLCIRGNHEEAVFSPEDAAALGIGGHLEPVLHWCREALGGEDLDFLGRFVPRASLELGGGLTALLYHGSPRSSVESICSDTPGEVLGERLGDTAGAALAVGGHTHVPMLRPYGELWVVNPGSVGCAFRSPPLAPPSPSLVPYAEYLVVDCDGRDIRLDFRRVGFDVVGYCDVLARSDLPLRDWWLGEYRRLGYLP
jgi:predicted phosphodiesterase